MLYYILIMPYKISDYSFQQARKIGVTIKPSINKNKKIDVYKNKKKIASIGDVNYSDFPTYLDEKGKTYADKRRKLYKIRHKKDLNSGAGYYANKILW